MIRYALEKDLDELVNMRLEEQKALHPNVTPTQDQVDSIRGWIKKSIGDVDILMLVCEKDSKICSTCTFVIEHNIPGVADNGNYAYLCNVFTNPKFRKRGIMEDMLGQGESELKTRNVCAVYFDSVSDPMISLSQKLGYEHRTSFYSKDL